MTPAWVVPVGATGAYFFWTRLWDLQRVTWEGVSSCS